MSSITTIRNRTYATIQKKYNIIDKRTYDALLRKYYNISSSKTKLLKFESDLSQYNSKEVTIATLKKNVQAEKKIITEAKKELNVMLHSDKKVVSCYYTIFRPIPATYQGTQQIQFKGDSYVPLTSSFYLSKISSFPQALLQKVKNAEHIKADEIKEDDYDFLHQMNGYSEFVSRIGDFSKSQDDLLLVQANASIDKIENEPVNIGNEDAFDDSYASPIISVIKDYIDYTPSIRNFFKVDRSVQSSSGHPLNDPPEEKVRKVKIVQNLKLDYDDEITPSNHFASLYKNEYVIGNYKSRSCWLSMILETFKDSVDKYSQKKHKKPIEVTYEYVHRIIAPERDLLESDNGYNFYEVVKFFKLFKIAIYLFDIHFNVKEYYEPSARNKNIGCAVIYVIQHDRHIYKLNHNLKRLEQKLQYHIDNLQQICKAPNDKYFLKKQDEEVKSYLIEGVDDVFRIMEDETMMGNIHLLYNKSDCFDLWLEFYEKGIKPSTLMSKGQVSFNVIRLDIVKGKSISIYANQQEGVSESSKFKDQEEFSYYTERKNWATNHLLTKNYLSNYSNNVKEMLSTYMPTALIGGVGDYPEYEEKIKTFQLDFNKYYTSLLRDMPHIPIVNSFDNFQDYCDESIEDMNVYFVEKLTSDMCYPLNQFNICYGKNIIGVNNIKIIAQLKVSQQKENCAKGIIEKLYKDEKLTETMKKDIINHIVGKYNKSNNTKLFTSITSNRDEALRTKKDYGGKIIPIPDSKLFANCIQNQQELEQGFRLISLYIYDTANKKLLELKESIEKYGLEVYKCNTDCVYVENDSEKLNLFIRDNANLFKYSSKGDWDAIGKIKVETKYIKPYSLLRKSYASNIYEIIKPINKSWKVALKNEWNNDEISDNIDYFDNLIITADIAGAGKSHSFKYHAKNKGESTLFITPYNALALEIKKEGYDALTLDKLLGNVFDGENNLEGKKSFDYSQYKRIVFDEIFLHDIQKLEQIQKFMRGNASFKFNATGDPNQLQPVKQELKMNAKQYYLDIIFSMFPNNINLQENKRCKTKEDQDKIKKMTMEIRTANSKVECIQILRKYNIKMIYDKKNITTRKNVVALNKTCDWVNDVVCKKYQDTKYFVGMEIICRKSLKIGKMRTYVNYTYVVKEMKEKVFVLDDGDEEIEVFNDLIYKFFRLPYARTCHSYQGMSENEAITIFDINHFMVDIAWIYTAITRTTQLENIHIYLGEMDDGTKELRKQIENMIVGHINADSDAGRDIVGKFITANWVMNQLKDTKMCKYCNKDLDISSVECFSVDRIDNNLAHTEMNCQIICRHCNVSKK